MRPAPCGAPPVREWKMRAFLFGCCFLTLADPALGQSLYLGASASLGHSKLNTRNISSADTVVPLSTAFATICTDGLVQMPTNATEMCSASRDRSKLLLAVQLVGGKWPDWWNVQTTWWLSWYFYAMLLGMFVVVWGCCCGCPGCGDGVARSDLFGSGLFSIALSPIIIVLPTIGMIAWSIICLAVCAIFILVVHPIAGPLLTCLHVSFHVVDQAIWCVPALGNLPAAVTLRNAMFGLGWVTLEGVRMLDSPSQRPAKQNKILPLLSAVQLYCASMGAISALTAGHTKLALWTFCVAILSLIKVMYAFLPQGLSTGYYMTYIGSDLFLDCSVLALSLFAARTASVAFIELYICMTATSTIGLFRFLVQWPGLMKEYWFGTDALTGLRKVEKRLLPWDDLKPGAQVFRTGAFGLGWLTHHGVFVGKMDYFHYKFNVPKSTVFLSWQDDMTLAGYLIEEWNRQHPEMQVVRGDTVMAVNGRSVEHPPGTCIAGLEEAVREVIRQSTTLIITMKPAPFGPVREVYTITINKFDMLNLVGLGPSLDLTLEYWTVPRVISPDGWRLQEPADWWGHRRSCQSEQNLDSPELPCTGDLVLHVEEVTETQLQLTLRRPVVVQGEHDRVIEMSGSPGNVSIVGTKWLDFQRALNASGSVTTAGGLLPQFRTICFIRQHESLSAPSTAEDPETTVWRTRIPLPPRQKNAVERALASQYQKVSYGMHCNCETFALWCVLPHDDTNNHDGFRGRRPPQGEQTSPQGQGLGSLGLACFAGISGALGWCFLSCWANVAFVVALVVTLKVYHANRIIAFTSRRHTGAFMDLELVPSWQEENEGTRLLES